MGGGRGTEVGANGGSSPGMWLRTPLFMLSHRESRVGSKALSNTRAPLNTTTAKTDPLRSTLLYSSLIPDMVLVGEGVASPVAPSTASDNTTLSNPDPFPPALPPGRASPPPFHLPAVSRSWPCALALIPHQPLRFVAYSQSCPDMPYGDGCRNMFHIVPSARNAQVSSVQTAEKKQPLAGGSNLSKIIWLTPSSTPRQLAPHYCCPQPRAHAVSG